MVLSPVEAVLFLKELLKIEENGWGQQPPLVVYLKSTYVVSVLSVADEADKGKMLYTAQMSTDDSKRNFFDLNMILGMHRHGTSWPILIFDLK